MTDIKQSSTSNISMDQVRAGWASDRDLANYYSVSRATIWRWAQQGKLPTPEKLSPGVTRWRWSEAAK